MFALRTKCFVALMMIVLTGCKEDGCGVPVDKAVNLTVLKSALTLKMESATPLDPLEFLLDSTIVWDDIELSLNLKGKPLSTTHLSLSANGLKLTSRNGRPVHGAMVYTSKKNSSNLVLKFAHLSVNGAESFASFLSRLKKNKGTLVLQVERFERGNSGKTVVLEIIDGVLAFKGKSKKVCTQPTPTTTPTPTPAPTPTPVPEVPVTTITAMDPAKSPTASTSALFSFASSVDGSTFWCSLDQAMAEACSSPQAYSGLLSGVHSFRVYAQSPQGALETLGAMASWTVDAISPSVTISNANSLPSLTNSNAISFEFSASKTGSTFKCALDGGVAALCSSPLSYSALSEGLHSFSVTAVDALGNVSKAPAIFKWTVDRTVPETAFIDIMAPDTITNSTGKTLTFQASESSLFECALDGATFASCQSPVVLSAMTEGDHRFEVRAIDAAGNQGPAASYAWSVDLTAPSVTVGVTAPSPGVTNAKNISVEFAASEPATLYCSMDGAPSVVCTSPLSMPDVTEGDHRVELTAVDLAGNIGPSQVLQWQMDFSAPNISLGDVLPSASSYLSTHDVSISVNVPEGARLMAVINGEPAVESANPLLLSDLPEGPQEISFQAFDAAGNASEILTHAFIVDRTIPRLSLQVENPSSWVNLDRNSFTFSATEEVKYECALDGSGFSNCESPVNYAGLADGEHAFQVRGVDFAGNVSRLSEYHWTIDTQAPTTLMAANIAGTGASFALSSSESPASYLCALDGAAFAPCGAVMSYAGLAEGLHSFQARAVDAAGNVDPVGATRSWTVDTIAPVASNWLTSVTTNSITVTWTTNEPATTQVRYGLGFNASQATAEILDLTTSHSVKLSGLSSNSTYTLQIYGKDASGNAFLSATRTVKTNR
jgi:hypothetical protein